MRLKFKMNNLKLIGGSPVRLIRNKGQPNKICWDKGEPNKICDLLGIKVSPIRFVGNKVRHYDTTLLTS